MQFNTRHDALKGLIPNMSEAQAAICKDEGWSLTSDVDAIFAAGGNAIFVDSLEALKAELKKRHDIGLEPGLTKIISDSYGYSNETVRINDEPIVDADKIKTQEQLEDLCRKVGKVNLYHWLHSHQGFDRERYNDHPEFLCDWEHLTFDPSKKRSILNRIKSNKERLDRLGIIRVYDLRLVLSALHAALLSSSFGVAIQRFRYPRATKDLMEAIVECYKIATFLQVRHKAREHGDWKPALTKIAPLLRKYAKEKGHNYSFVAIATNEYRLADINIRTPNKEKKHGKVKR